MTKKPWLSEPGGAQLQAFLGVWGVRTSEFADTTDLLMKAADVFEIPMASTCAEMAAAIEAIPKKQRSALGRKNVRGEDVDTSSGAPKVRREKTPAEELLHHVVMAVINSGNSDLLKEIEELNEYYNCRIPTVAEVVGGRPETAIITGGITWEDKVYRFECARTIRRSA